jgi:peptide/nickel transport system permease protein
MAEQAAPTVSRVATLRSRISTELVVGILMGGLLAALLLLRPWLSDHDPMGTDLLNRYQPPGTPGHWLGTDQLGRDLWARALAGLEWSMTTAIMATAISLVIGTLLGLLAAQREGLVRTLVRQSIDTILSFPGLIVAICVVALWGQGYWPIVLTLGLLSWPVFARVCFAEALSLLEREYVQSAALAGMSRFQILIQHVLPGLRPVLMVMLAFHFASMLISESALSFLGLGAPLGEPTWGNMLAASRAELFEAPWMMLVPAAGIVIAVVTANLIGDGIAALSRRQGKGIDV